MEGQIDLFTLLTLVVAVVAIFKLRNVLGRHTGDEDSRIEQRNRDLKATRGNGAAAAQDKVVTLPRREREEAVPSVAAQASVADNEARIKTLAGTDSAVSDGLLSILKSDPDFDPEQFLKGARQAYEMIVTAFAEGNRKTLRDLLSPSVYESFVRAITERESRGEQVDQSFVGISKADITEAQMDKGSAQVGVRFVSQLITATRDSSGNVIEGDAGKVSDVTDVWTFSRDVSTAAARRNPNWKVIET